MRNVKRTPVVDVAAIKRKVLAREAKEREQLAKRSLLATELAVLWAMITHYDFELFAHVESAEFLDPRNRVVFNAMRDLEAAGKAVDGEFLLTDIAARIEDLDRQLDKHVRDHVTDGFLHALVNPPAWVVRPPDRESIARAIARLEVEANCRRACPDSALEATEIAGEMLRKAWR